MTDKVLRMDAWQNRGLKIRKSVVAVSDQTILR